MCIYQVHIYSHTYIIFNQAINPIENNRKNKQNQSKNRTWWVPILQMMETEKNLNSLLAIQANIDQGKDAYNRFKSFKDINVRFI